jgi:hypothetical protein
MIMEQDEATIEYQPFKIGDKVKVKGITTLVLKVNNEHKRCLLKWGESDWCWWPVKELTLITPIQQKTLFDEIEASGFALKEYERIAMNIAIWQQTGEIT